jgi:hypothetical protein
MDRRVRDEMTRQDEREGVKLSDLCAVAVMEANVDQKYLNAGDYTRSIEGCTRAPCRCHEEGCW